MFDEKSAAAGSSPNTTAMYDNKSATDSTSKSFADVDATPASPVSGSALATAETSGEMKRDLGSRHLQFIAIGGTIGTGLFLGTGNALATGGPIGCLIAFAFVGVVVYSVMTALGEMAAYIPVTGSFAVYASRFVDPSLGFAMGWMYWFSWSVTFALELTAAGIIIQYWNDSLNIAIFITVFLFIFTALNFLPVKIYGDVEMYFSMIKVVTIVGWVIFAICVNCGVGKQEYLGFKYWKDPGPFVEVQAEGATGRFIGFWAVMVTASFSYQGAELVGIGAGETADPGKAVPRAVKWTFWGVFTLFVSTIFMVGLVVPSNNPSLNSDATDASASPLVIAANLAGIPVLPDILNAVLLTAVLSAANSNVYSGSRILVGLAEQGHAPSFLRRSNKSGVPMAGVLCTSGVGLLAYMNLTASGSSVFNWLLNIVAIAGLITWACISFSHLRFLQILKQRNIDRDTLPYKAPFQPWLSIFGAFFTVLITLTNGFQSFIEWSTEGFFTAYVSVMIFIVLLVTHKLVYRTKMINIEDADISLPERDATGKLIKRDAQGNIIIDVGGH
ncbi:Arginine permease [Ceratocystis fimbriata CBS 114723]|uniref:Arginine permease n=1 Tax=Ceratocystis fimbriata CBS 114723 TaxID=1035309 RepID=A0A2C5X1T1_9PEZI|nr:Arginine permease [Ceratocystis fimbriata CBS 114723]